LRPNNDNTDFLLTGSTNGIDLSYQSICLTQMNQFQLTGGARIGMLHASWPFATLTVTNERLDLNASLIGTYSFTADQLFHEPYGQSCWRPGYQN